MPTKTETMDTSASQWT